MTKNSVGWQIPMKAKFGFKLQVTATPEFHSLYDWCCQIIRLFANAPENPPEDSAVEKHGADALYSGVKCSMDAICTADNAGHLDVVHRIIQIAKLWMIRQWLDSRLANGKPLVWIPKENAHLMHLEWTEDKHANLKALVESYTS